MQLWFYDCTLSLSHHTTSSQQLRSVSFTADHYGWPLRLDTTAASTQTHQLVYVQYRHHFGVCLTITQNENISLTNICSIHTSNALILKSSFGLEINKYIPVLRFNYRLRYQNIAQKPLCNSIHFVSPPHNKHFRLYSSIRSFLNISLNHFVFTYHQLNRNLFFQASPPRMLFCIHIFLY